MIARNIRMERQVDKTSAIVLVEGVTDIKRLKPFLDADRCVVIQCWGRRNVLDAMEVLRERAPVGVLALADADFDRLLARLPNDGRIIVSETHDFDLDWLRPRVFERYLDEVGDIAKVSAHGGASAVFEMLLKGLKPVSVARLLNAKKQISYKVSSINSAPYFAGFSIDLQKYVAELTAEATNRQKEAEDVTSLIIAEAAKEFDLLQLTNGHDFYCVLGASLRDDLGDKKEAQVFGGECEAHVRLAFSAGDFRACSLFRSLLSWEHQNPPFLLLHADFRT